MLGASWRWLRGALAGPQLRQRRRAHFAQDHSEHVLSDDRAACEDLWRLPDLGEQLFHDNFSALGASRLRHSKREESFVMSIV